MIIFRSEPKKPQKKYHTRIFTRKPHLSPDTLDGRDIEIYTLIPEFWKEIEEFGNVKISTGRVADWHWLRLNVDLAYSYYEVLDYLADLAEEVFYGRKRRTG